MSTLKKQIGDQVMITAGQFKNQTGKLIVKNRGGWTVELDDGQQVAVSFPMVALVQNSEPQTETENSTAEESAVESSELTQIEDVTDQADSVTQTDEIITTKSESSTEDKDTTQEADAQDITKMTVKQLQALAKQRGIGIARTKSDFHRIINEKNPDEDLDQLTGKTLFNRVSELHISRLRTKEDLVRMLQDS